MGTWYFKGHVNTQNNPFWKFNSMIIGCFVLMECIENPRENVYVKPLYLRNSLRHATSLMVNYMKRRAWNKLVYKCLILFIRDSAGWDVARESNRLQFCTEYGSITVVFWAKYLNDWVTGKYVMDNEISRPKLACKREYRSHTSYCNSHQIMFAYVPVQILK